MTERFVAPRVRKEFTDEIIGNAWVHTDVNGKEYLNLEIGSKVEGKIVLVAGSALKLVKGKPKRTTINPETGKVYQDADFMIVMDNG